MASRSAVEAMLNSFALQWRFDFNPDTPTWPSVVAQWEQRLQPFEDDVLIQVTGQALDEFTAAPKIADIRARCVSLRPRQVNRPDYLDELPQRSYGDAAQASAVNRSIREKYGVQIAAAKKGFQKLLAEVGAARAAGDDARLKRAEAAVQEARSPQAYRRWQVFWLEKEQPGSSESLPALVEPCQLCRGHGYVVVSYKALRGLPFHWTPVPKSSNAPGNTAGIMYYCPRCVTPTKDKQDDYAAPEATYQAPVETYA